jgi:hypothetical protein
MLLQYLYNLKGNVVQIICNSFAKRRIPQLFALKLQVQRREEPETG